MLQQLNESIDEICLEDFIDQEILEPELKSGCQAIAVDTLQLYGDRRRQREKKEVMIVNPWGAETGIFYVYYS